MPKKIDFDWQAVVDGNRIGIAQVLAGIRSGEVDELELEKLQNFVQFSLALMQLFMCKQGGRMTDRAKV